MERIMYKAVFADDEIIVREGIQQKVEWNKNGFELAEVFSNGEQVVQYIQKHPDVDLVISDI
ncbi:MAG: response regulator, partial [Spirochaetia bacterium]|nr:response regulator [Spirochaetia bacterium]